MHSLYVDSTSGLVVGLLDSEFQWVEYHESAEKKPSEVIHQIIFELITKHHLNLKEMNFFFSAGPGSYTGMRLGEGIAQILEWSARNVFSFHHFDVPKLAGVQNGFWVTNAFKGQVFIYTWDVAQGIAERELVNAQDFSIVDPELGYTLSADVAQFSTLKTTKELLKNSSKEIFSKIYANKTREAPFYFRTLDEEFK